MSSFLNASGEVQQLAPTMVMYREAAERGQSLQQYLSSNFETDASKYGSVFEQLCESEGMFARPNRELGIRATTLVDILEGRPSQSAGPTVKDAIPASRILFPAFFMQAIEDRLLANQTMNANALDAMIAVDDSVNGDRYEQPQINFTGPSAARSQRVGQLQAPPSMLTITTSDRPYKIPAFALGLEISDQAIRASTIDMVALSVARQILIERNERAGQYLLAALQGDVDNGEAALSTFTGPSAAGVQNPAQSAKYRTSVSLDAAATGGVLTQKAWMKFLIGNSKYRTLSHIVTDLDGALAIQNRTGRPIITGDNGTSPRINTIESVMNPLWAPTISMFIQNDGTWPANMIMGLDRNYALRRVRNLQAEYSATEAFVMRRAQQMRFDFGEHVTRMFIDAFDVMAIS